MFIIPIIVEGRTPARGRLEFFVVTGSMEPPIAGLAGNDGYADVRSITANAEMYNGQRGVRVTIMLADDRAGRAIALNIAQNNMLGSQGVIPLG